MNDSRDLLMWNKESYAHDNDSTLVVAKFMLMFFLILLVVIYLQHFISKIIKFHYFPEAGVAVVIGMIVSGIFRLSELYGTALNNQHNNVDKFLGFNTNLFFLGLLPPIIFNSGYQIKHHLFFANMGGISSLAFYGTAFSAFFVGLFLWICGKINITPQITLMEALCFGSLISATDPVSTLAVFSELKVDPTLFYLVFGESVLNDAIGISLFNTTSHFVGKEMTIEAVFSAIGIFLMTFGLSCLIGYVMGVLTAGLLKAIDLSHHPNVMMTVFVIMVYVPFLVSEVLQLSGIVTILFSALTLKRYCIHSIPTNVQHSFQFFFEVMAFITETAVFIYLGFSVFSENYSYNTSFIFLSLLFCLLFRAGHVYPIFYFLNYYRQQKEERKKALGGVKEYAVVPMNTQHMIFFAGLRGAVAYALSNVFPDIYGNRKLIVGTTMMLILITIFTMGGLTIDTLKWLNLQTGVDVEPYLKKLQSTYRPNKFIKFEHRFIYPFVLKNHEEHIARDYAGIRTLERRMSASSEMELPINLIKKVNETESIEIHKTDNLKENTTNPMVSPIEF